MFLAEILGLDPPPSLSDPSCASRLQMVSASTTTTFAWRPRSVDHYAFLVTEEEFDAIFTRVTERGPYLLG